MFNQGCDKWMGFTSDKTFGNINSYLYMSRVFL